MIGNETNGIIMNATLTYATQHGSEIGKEYRKMGESIGKILKKWEKVKGRNTERWEKA